MNISLRYIQRLLSISTELSPKILKRDYVRKSRPPPNVGLSKQLELLEEQEEIDLDDPALDFDEHESDFYNVGESYSEFKKDVEDYKEKEKGYIIKRKYFKEPHYNFLTWSEKEQIKYLHQSDPVAYSVERLAEIFPATCEIIHKIAKANWKVSNPNKILNHDKAVELNWQLLKKGELQLNDKTYKEHLLKFSSREKIVLDELNYLPQEIVKVDKPNFTTNSKQFSTIIQSYNDAIKKQDEPKQIETSPDDIINFGQTDKPLQETYVLKNDNKKFKGLQTFSTFKKKMEAELNLPSKEQTEVKVDSPSSKDKQIFVQEKPVPIFGKQYEENFINSKSIDYLPIRKKINIPKKLWKRGQTYKVNDCFYDDDGRFMYRVPGLE